MFEVKLRLGSPLAFGAQGPIDKTCGSVDRASMGVRSTSRLLLVVVLLCGFTYAADRLPLSAQLTRMQSQIDVLRRDVDQLLGELHRPSLPEPPNPEGDGNVYAHCRMVPNGVYDPDTYEPIVGDIDMRQRAVGGQMDVKVFLYGFMTPKSVHALHIHKYGDLREGCGSAGDHYNPGGNNHSAPYDKDRHMGDWGNVMVDEFGMVDESFTDKVTTLVGPNSIMGRTVVIHIGEEWVKGDTQRVS